MKSPSKMGKGQVKDRIMAKKRQATWTYLNKMVAIIVKPLQ